MKYVDWILIVAILFALFALVKLLKTGRAYLGFLWISRGANKGGRKKLSARYIQNLQKWFIAEIFALLVIVTIAAIKGWIF